jgi:alkylated DNA repair dioxygenase AlkB
VSSRKFVLQPLLTNRSNENQKTKAQKSMSVELVAHARTKVALWRGLLTSRLTKVATVLMMSVIFLPHASRGGVVYALAIGVLFLVFYIGCETYNTRRRWLMSFDATISAHAVCVPLGPGSVLIRNALDENAQLTLVRYAMHVDSVDPDGGFWFRDRAGSKLHLNATRSRGRIYQRLDVYPYPETIRQLCTQLVQFAKSKSRVSLPVMSPTHLLLLYYMSSNGLRWHRDTDPNDGDNREPIVSLSLGNTCTFGYKKYGHPKEYVEVRSGDVLIWGGSERNLLHNIERVTTLSASDTIRNIIGDARLNFTFRSAPNILGFEKQYASKQYFIDES